MDSWIKLFRKFREWEWYGDTNVSRVFLELLLTANFEDKEWKGIVVKRGQTVIGRKSLAYILGLSEQKIRTSIIKLKSTNEITSKQYNKFSVITINNFEKYQQSTSDLTSNQPATNQQLTTPKEYKNIRIKEYIYSSLEYLKNIPSKDIEEFEKKYKATKSQIVELSEKLLTWCLSSGKRKKNYKAFMQNRLLDKFGKRLVVENNITENIETISKEQRLKNIEKIKQIKSKLI